MKRSLSLLVVQVFTLNTLLSTSGLAHVAWSADFSAQKRTVANENTTPPEQTPPEQQPKEEKTSFAGKNLFTNIPIKTSGMDSSKMAPTTQPAEGSPRADFSNRRAIRPTSFNFNTSAPKAVPAQENLDVAAHQLAPESHNVGGSTMNVDVTANLAPEEQETEGKKAVDVKVEGNVEIPPITEAERKAIHDMFAPNEIRRMLKEDRRNLVKEEIAAWLDQAQRGPHGRDQAAKAEWQKSIWGAQTRKFPMETVMFFFAISAINFGMLLNDYSQNPLIMEQHFQTLMDPIGHISFYSFMIVNGYATEFLNSRGLSKEITAAKMKTILAHPRYQQLAIDKAVGDKALQNRILTVMADDAIALADRARSVNPFTNSIAKKAYIELIPYLSMTAGSMASHFSGDFLRTLQACVTGMYKDPRMQKDKPVEADQAQVKDRLNNLSQDPCDVAWREWVIEKKFNTYSPALMSMMLSTAGSAVLTKMFKSSEKIGPIGKIFETVRKTKMGVAAKLKFEGSNLLLRSVGTKLSGWWTGGFQLVGHFSNITIFTALDTAIHSWVEDKVLNFNYGVYYIWPKIDSFPRKAEILNDLIVKEGSEKFMKDSSACEKDIESVDCRRNDIEGWLYNFSHSMAKWREFNQTKALQAHSQWVDKINKFQTMERFSKAFYEQFMLDVKNRKLCFSNKEECFGNPIASANGSTRIEDMINAKQEAEKRGDLSVLIEDRTFLNYRQFPLYGVEPLLAGLKEPEKWKAMYFQDPDRVQELQQEKVHKVAAIFEAYITRKGWDSSDLKNYKEKIKEVVEGLKSEDAYKNGLAINTMRSMANASSQQVNDVVQAIMQDHLNMMGRPAPLFYYGQGLPYLFETSDLYKDLVKDVELPEFYRHLRLNTQFRFEKKTDYLYYHMLCGPNPEKGGIPGSVVDGKLGNLYGYGFLGSEIYLFRPK